MSSNGSSELCFAAAQNNLAIVQDLISRRNVNVNEVDGSGQTALHHASRLGHIDIVEYLLEKGANVNAQTNQGKTPLHQAASTGSDFVVRALAKQQALNIDAKTTDDRNWTAIHFAVYADHASTIKLLFEVGADVNATGAREWTPLHQAAYLGRLDCVKTLLNCGAIPNLVNASGRFAYKLAKQQKHVEIYKILEKITKKMDKSPRSGIRGSPKLISKGSKGLLKLKPSVSEYKMSTPPSNSKSGSKLVLNRAQPQLVTNSTSSSSQVHIPPSFVAQYWKCSCGYTHNQTDACVVCGNGKPLNQKPNSILTKSSSETNISNNLDPRVSEVLRELDLQSYEAVFATNEIDLAALLLLTEQDLKDLGISALGPRRKLLARIADPSYTPFKPHYSGHMPPPVPPALDSASERRRDAFKQYGRWQPPGVNDAFPALDDDEHIYDVAPPPKPINDEDPPYRALPVQTSFDFNEGPDFESSEEDSDADDVYGFMPTVEPQSAHADSDKC